MADATGNYSFTGLLNGSYTVTPGKAGFTFAPASQAVTVSSRNVSGVNFAAQPVTSAARSLRLETERARPSR